MWGFLRPGLMTNKVMTCEVLQHTAVMLAPAGDMAKKPKNLGKKLEMTPQVGEKDRFSLGKKFCNMGYNPIPTNF